MKQIITILLPIFFSVTLIAQYAFQKIIGGPEEQRIYRVCEVENGCFLLSGRIQNSVTETSEAYVIKIDETGSLIQDKRINTNDSLGCTLYNVHYINGEYHFLGNYKNKLWYLNLDTDFEIINEKIHGIQKDSWFSYMSSVVDSDSNFVITGYVSRPDSSAPGPYNMDPYFYKLSGNGDSLTSMFKETNYHLMMSFNIIEKPDYSGYFAYGVKFSDLLPFAGQRLELNKQFDSLNIEVVPYMINSFFSPTYIDNSTILLCGGGGHPDSVESYSLNVLSTTIDNQPINYEGFKMDGDERDHPAMHQGVSINENNIFIGGTSNFDYYNPFLSNKDSWYHLVKINPDIMPIWEYWYGGDAYYHLYSILATNDGGCLLVGNRYDDQVQYMERDIYIVKVDSEGLITWENEYKLESEILKLYPVPAFNNITIEYNISSVQNETFLIISDITGKLIDKINIVGNKGEKVIDVRSYPAGVYIYTLISNERRNTGRFIVQ